MAKDAFRDEAGARSYRRIVPNGPWPLADLLLSVVSADGGQARRALTPLAGLASSSGVVPRSLVCLGSQVHRSREHHRGGLDLELELKRMGDYRPWARCPAAPWSARPCMVRHRRSSPRPELSGAYGTCAPSNRPLQPSHSAVTPLACATGAPAGGRLNGGVRLPYERGLR